MAYSRYHLKAKQQMFLDLYKHLESFMGYSEIYQKKSDIALLTDLEKCVLLSILYRFSDNYEEVGRELEEVNNAATYSYK